MQTYIYIYEKTLIYKVRVNDKSLSYNTRRISISCIFKYYDEAKRFAEYINEYSYEPLHIDEEIIKIPFCVLDYAHNGKRETFESIDTWHRVDIDGSYYDKHEYCSELYLLNLMSNMDLSYKFNLEHVVDKFDTYDKARAEYAYLQKLYEDGKIFE